jgi:RNAse (barnase) inhibitor barstar
MLRILNSIEIAFVHKSIEKTQKFKYFLRFLQVFKRTEGRF